ncbi:NAD(P)/FAD-dependent oxidoreductase [Metabacillus fastidiosus]|nr:NAD(P)/FAD-dependent oxidoreductase [Metabacillus fastidiosus]
MLRGVHMIYDIIIVGAGQAGLTMGYYLKKTNLSFLIIDQCSEIGEVWRTRYDSLTLFTPRSYSSLPGSKLVGNKNNYPTKDEIADYLAYYVEEHALPVQLNTIVQILSKEKDSFHITTNQGLFEAKQIVIATGPFQKPFIPDCSKLLSKEIFQIHSAHYKNKDQLKEGSVLVVGGGNSGCQIAVELAEERDVHLSVSKKLKFLPQDIGGHSIFHWFDKLGILKATVHSSAGRFLKRQADPIFDKELKALLKKKQVTLKPRLTSVKDDKLIFQDVSELKANNIIWSTGFKYDYSWVHIPQAFHSDGSPVHERGVTPVNGLYFLGLPWQYRRGSALLQGVGYDASYLYEKIKERTLYETE